MRHRRGSLRRQIRSLRRSKSDLGPQEAHRQAVVAMLNSCPPRFCAAATKLTSLCFEPLSTVSWSPSKSLALLREMERCGEIRVDWQQQLDGSEEPSWIWLASQQDPAGLHVHHHTESEDKS
jgi:hypothetical protein